MWHLHVRLLTIWIRFITQDVYTIKRICPDILEHRRRSKLKTQLNAAKCSVTVHANLPRSVEFTLGSFCVMTSYRNLTLTAKLKVPHQTQVMPATKWHQLDVFTYILYGIRVKNVLFDLGDVEPSDSNQLLVEPGFTLDEKSVEISWDVFV